jgi:hypothetical protein
MTSVATGRTGIGWLLIGLLCIPQFVESFAEAGQPLPMITQVFAGSYGLVWLAPLAVVATWLAGRARTSALIGCIALMLATPVALFAAYLPLFKLGTLF